MVQLNEVRSLGWRWWLPVGALTTLVACHSGMRAGRAVDGGGDSGGSDPAADAPVPSTPDVWVPEREVQPGWYGLGTSELTPWKPQTAGSVDAGGPAVSSAGPGVIFDRQDQPIVAWMSASFEICARRLVASGWEALGCVALSGTTKSYFADGAFSLAVDSQNTLYLAAVSWSDPSSPLHVFAREAGIWHELPSPGAAVRLSKSLYALRSLLIGADDRPLVAVSSTGTDAVSVMAWTGTGWSSRGSLSGLAALVLDPDRTPVAAVIDSAGALRFQRNAGDRWIDLGLTPLPLASSPRRNAIVGVAIDEQQRPVVARVLQDGTDPTNFAEQLIVSRWSGTGWEELGTTRKIQGTYWADFLSIAAGQPLLLWQSELFDPLDMSTTVSNHLARWSGSAWEELAALPTDTSVIDLATDSQGHPFVVLSGANDYGLWWNGARWVEVGTTAGSGLSNLPASTMPALALDAIGNPVVAWLGPSGGAYVRRWDGTAWAEMAGSGSGDGIGSVGGQRKEVSSKYVPRPQLALDAQDKPTVLWQAGQVAEPPRLRSYDGSVWRALGDSDGKEGLFSAVKLPADACPTMEDRHLVPSLALGRGGRPMVAWSWERRQEYHCDLAWENDTLATFVLAWNGSAWAALAGSGTPPGVGMTSYPVALAIGAQDAPIVFGPQFGGPCSPIRYDGSAWQTVGNSAWPVPCGGGINNRTLAVTSAGNPVVAWTTTAPEVYLLRWTGSRWEELDGSASGDGVTRSNHQVGQYAMTVDPYDRPVVAWEDSSSGQSQIYLRRWSGVHWEEVQGSATNGGVSASDTPASAPSVAARAGRLCVAWHSAAFMQESEIRLRCTDW